MQRRNKQDRFHPVCRLCSPFVPQLEQAPPCRHISGSRGSDIGRLPWRSKQQHSWSLAHKTPSLEFGQVCNRPTQPWILGRSWRSCRNPKKMNWKRPGQLKSRFMISYSMHQKQKIIFSVWPAEEHSSVSTCNGHVSMLEGDVARHWISGRDLFFKQAPHSLHLMTEQTDFF